MARPLHYDNRYRKILRQRIDALTGDVFKRAELSSDRSNREQLRLNRALKAFVVLGLIIKIGHGLYAKAEKMTFSNGETQPVLKNSFESIAIEALEKLGIKWELGKAIQEYNRGETTQVPAVFSVQLKSRFRGTIKAEGRHIMFDGDVNAR